MKYSTDNHISSFLGILSILVSASGIALLLYSLAQEELLPCASPLSGGICSIGTILLHGILSLLLILTTAQMSIAATLVAFHCTGTRKNLANEVVYFLPSEIEEPKQTESVQNQSRFHIKKNPTDQNEENVLVSLIGNYTFFKLRASGSSVTQLEPPLSPLPPRPPPPPPPPLPPPPPITIEETLESTDSESSISRKGSTQICFSNITPKDSALVSYFSTPSRSNISIQKSLSLPSITDKPDYLE
ncbi:uncharacterized protein LOC110200735 [Phascolarctos cinereus]